MVKVGLGESTVRIIAATGDQGVPLPAGVTCMATPMPCFDDEASEILMHPLGAAFNVGDDHANHLSSGHALWAA
jgi:hypothetical protein